MFNGKINLTNASANSPTDWDVEFTFSDSEGVFDGNSVQEDDCLLIDTGNYQPGTVTRYRITNITSQDSSTVICNVVMDDNNFDPPDLSYSLGLDGAIGRPTGIQKLNITVAPGTQLLPDKFAEYPRNADAAQRIEYLGWKKFELTYADFATAATTLSITLYALPANVIIEKVIIKHTTAFEGGSINNYTVEIGILGETDKYTSPFDVFQAVSNSARQISTDDEVESFENPTNILITANCSGGNLDDATAGAFYVLLKLGAIQV